ncbi:hypothetical protein LOAG_08540 [Loa loa]|uniref:Uncharacterized protein n=1 Tax=Loa loa TaxID=7209 RepID=A0A1S0TTK9_LOALO|nr:hypothetical protein LOAG_08540 [Loa loa]EFO19951.1 hypothetical protein LOAG_08540 [Loa loa]
MNTNLKRIKKWHEFGCYRMQQNSNNINNLRELTEVPIQSIEYSSFNPTTPFPLPSAPIFTSHKKQETVSDAFTPTGDRYPETARNRLQKLLKASPTCVLIPPPTTLQ